MISEIYQLIFIEKDRWLVLKRNINQRLIKLESMLTDAFAINLKGDKVEFEL